jgi:UDP:flavonoid glycosyltransferase YjiC (YdhE family)
MTSSDAASLTASVVAALERTGQRAVLVSSWGGLAQISLPPNMLQIDNAPFDWLFARSSAVIHHGGAGTTATSLRAGVPTIVVPFTGDQPFWGMRVAELGAGPQPIPQQELTTERLVAAIHEATTNQAIRQQAAALGASITAENGVGRAIELIRSYSS